MSNTKSITCFIFCRKHPKSTEGVKTMDLNRRFLDKPREASLSSQKTPDQHLQELREHHTRFTPNPYRMEQSLSTSNCPEYSNSLTSPLDSHHNFDKNYDANNPYGFWEASGPPRDIEPKTKPSSPKDCNPNIIPTVRSFFGQIRL